MSLDSRKAIRVLFVEDAFDQALLVKAFLASAGGYEVVHTQDGDQAVQLIRDEKWDLVITDLNLPGTDGFEVIRVARAKDSILPILATTGYTEAEYHNRASREGASKLLTKPLDKTIFLKTVWGLVAENAGVQAPSDAVLAVGGLAGDAEMGCGGALIQAAAEGHPVVIVVLGQEEGDVKFTGLKASKAACDLLGFRLVVDKEALSDTRMRVALMKKAVAELRPRIVYMPSMDESHPARMEAFRVAKAATTEVPTVLSYETATTGLDYHPTHFVEVADQMAMKSEALEHFQAGTGGRPELAPEMAQAYARYWGRRQFFALVEAFEVIQDDA